MHAYRMDEAETEFFASHQFGIRNLVHLVSLIRRGFDLSPAGILIYKRRNGEKDPEIAGSVKRFHVGYMHPVIGHGFKLRG